MNTFYRNNEFFLLSSHYFTTMWYQLFKARVLCTRQVSYVNGLRI